MLKLENHELSSERADLAQRLKDLSLHESAVARASEVIRSIESKARQLVEAEGFLSLESLTSLLEYVPSAQGQLRDAEKSRVRSEASANQSSNAVAGRSARVKGFERVHDRIAAVHAQNIERDLTRESDELWLQRRSKDRD
jgi:hypothetical protein